MLSFPPAQAVNSVGTAQAFVKDVVLDGERDDRHRSSGERWADPEVREGLPGLASRSPTPRA
jgi:hypothetical protein